MMMMMIMTREGRPKNLLKIKSALTSVCVTNDYDHPCQDENRVQASRMMMKRWLIMAIQV